MFFEEAGQSLVNQSDCIDAGALKDREGCRAQPRPASAGLTLPGSVSAIAAMKSESQLREF